MQIGRHGAKANEKLRGLGLHLLRHALHVVVQHRGAAAGPVGPVRAGGDRRDVGPLEERCLEGDAVPEPLTMLIDVHAAISTPTAG